MLQGEGSSEPVVNAFSAIAKRKAFKDCFPADFEYHTCGTKITMSSPETWEAAMTKAGESLQREDVPSRAKAFGQLREHLRRARAHLEPRD